MVLASQVQDELVADRRVEVVGHERGGGRGRRHGSRLLDSVDLKAGGLAGLQRLLGAQVAAVVAAVGDGRHVRIQLVLGDGLAVHHRGVGRYGE